MDNEKMHPPLGNEMTLLSENGVPVYFSPNPALHSFCLSLYVRGGSLFEAPAESGSTHLLEHLLFRHLDNLLGGGLSRELDMRGLAFDAITYREFMWVSLSGAPKHLARAIEILSLLLAPLSVSREDLEAERARVRAEIREDGEKTSLEYFSDGVLYRDTSLVQSVLGSASSLARMTRVRLSAFKTALFTKENLFFCLTGNAEEENAEALATAIGAYKIPSGKKRESIAPLSDGVFKRNGLVAVRNSRRTVVRLSIDVDLSKTTDAALTLLYDILFGDGEECRLHRALSEKAGFIYSFSASLEQYKNVAFIHVLYEIPRGKLESSLSILLSVLKDAKLSIADALPYAKAPYTDNAAFVLDSARDFNFTLAYDRHILGLPYSSIEARKAAFLAVSAEDLLSLAREIFRPDCLALSIKADKRTLNEEALRAMLRGV